MDAHMQVSNPKYWKRTIISSKPTRASFRRAFFLILVIISSFGLQGKVLPQQQFTIRVGAYENEPKIYTNSDGNLVGFWPVLIENIAQEENWNIVWVHGTWEEGLNRLETNQIDIMPDVGWTPDRSERFAFSNETVLTSWSRVYVQQESAVETIVDLEGKKIAGLAGSVNFDGPEGIIELTSKLGLHCEFIGMSSYEEVFKSLENNEVDAGVVNKDFGELNDKKYKVGRTSIIIQPASLRFAFTKDAELTPLLINTIDPYLISFKDDPNSIYYQALDQYLGENVQKTFIEIIPAWVNNLLMYGGGIVLFLGVVIYVSRRQVRRRTIELHKSEERLRILLENNPDQIFRLDKNGVVLDYHSASKNLGFLTEDEIIEKSVRDVFAYDLSKSLLEKTTKAIQTGQIAVFEYSILSQRENRDFEARVIPNKNKEVIVLIRDITSIKEVERELRESEERYQTLAKISPVGIFRTDPDGYTTYVNPTWSQISGLSEEDALGVGWLNAVHPEDKDRLKINWRASFHQQAPSFEDYRFIHPDGSITWVIGQAVPELNAEDKLVGFVGTITDITERKKNEDLKAAVERAESADKLKSAFLATMSHELRTPLNSIIGFTGILLQKLVGSLNPEQEKQLKMVQVSANHLLELINDVLDISKIEADQIDIFPELFDMGTAVRRSVEKINPMAEKKGLVVTTVINPEIIMVYSDRRRVEQILINLLNNAVKFTEHGNINIQCTIEDENVITQVTDSGIGIKHEDIEDLFKPFQQIQTGISRQYEGTGLGLSICKRLVELLGGKIWVESEWGKGSTFRFKLPLKKEINER
jgi:PAS domain S-box-containing protein